MATERGLGDKDARVSGLWAALPWGRDVSPFITVPADADDAVSGLREPSDVSTGRASLSPNWLRAECHRCHPGHRVPSDAPAGSVLLTRQEEADLRQAPRCARQVRRPALIAATGGDQPLNVPIRPALLGDTNWQ
jgi:hypothetical protein